MALSRIVAPRVLATHRLLRTPVADRADRHPGRERRHAVLTLIAAASLLLILCGRLAWGPGIHIQLAQRLIDARHDLLPSERAERIDRHSDSFQYGCIAADIINMKRFGGLKNHCHNWDIRLRLGRFVETEAERAFVEGYLCHLAADVIAHNHFVPFHLLHDLPPYVLGHTYWEARADSSVDEETWHIIDALRTHTVLHENDELIHHAVPKKMLSMTSNKFIFNHVLLARSKKSWRQVMDRVRRENPVGTVHEGFLDRCLEACFENMVRTFDEGSFRELARFDPTGLEALRRARRLRRELLARSTNRETARVAAAMSAQENFGLG